MGIDIQVAEVDVTALTSKDITDMGDTKLAALIEANQGKAGIGVKEAVGRLQSEVDFRKRMKGNLDNIGLGDGSWGNELQAPGSDGAVLVQ